MLAKRDPRHRSHNQVRQVEPYSRPRAERASRQYEQPHGQLEPRRDTRRQHGPANDLDLFSDPFSMGRDMFAGMNQMMQRFDAMSRDMMSFGGSMMPSEGAGHSGGGKFVSRTMT